MSMFEVKVTPTRLKPATKQTGREPVHVIFAPFSAKAIVTFEDVPVNKTARRLLILSNPSNEDIRVTVTKNLRPEYNADLEWTSTKIRANDQVQLEIVWSPTKLFSCKETLQFTDSRNFKKDVTLIFKSLLPKGEQKGKKRVDSTKNLHKNVKIRSSSPPVTFERTQKSPVKLKRAATISHEVYNYREEYESTTFAQVENVKYVERKLNNFGGENLAIHEFGKENMSPNSPNGLRRDNCSVTPTGPNQSNIDYLASLPTPIIEIGTNARSGNRPEYNVQPKQLQKFFQADESPRKRKNHFSAGQSERHHYDVIVKTEVRSYTENDEIQEVIELPVIKLSTPDKSIREEKCEFWNTNQNYTEDKAQIINKTFDLKTRNHDISYGSLSHSPAKGESVEFVIQTEYHQINNLITIEEEGGETIFERTQNKLEKTFNITDQQEQQQSAQIEDVKRDIKLVSTPLQKCSESLQDLSRSQNRSAYYMMGSLPNLNKMENMTPIDENRYYHKDEVGSCHDDSRCSTVSSASTNPPPDILFNQNEILAQSSRLNLHEVSSKHYSKQTQYIQPSSPKEFSKRGREMSYDSIASSQYLQVDRGYGYTTSVSPPKRTRFDERECSSRTPSRRNTSKSALQNWARTKPKAKLEKTLILMKKPQTPRKTLQTEPVIKLYNTELYLRPYINPDPFAATTTCDPFLTATMYLDERSVNSHEEQFKKWLNALVSIPAELDSGCNQKIDVGRLFNEVRNKDVSLAPTKEQQSMNYLTKSRMNSLRTAAVNLFMSEEMKVPCSKVAVCINKGLMKIRTDRDLHLDVVMQRQILELLLCFNPLWLRIGLEAVFGEIIYMHSNADVVSLSAFILNRLFRDKHVEQKHSRAYTLSAEYSDYIKKFTLQKVLFLLLFLDKAKNKKIIKHNPCLFVRESPYKETKEILLRFSSELLANIGDVTRGLRRFGYFLTHKQTFLDEFNYAFKNLAVDLRDGIRLNRVMEIILLKENLTTQLRVPAISRLQRIFNVNLALKALSEAGFTLSGDITAADIVDGHREKTLSLLWQIIYIFRSPKFHASATVLQKWWRNSWLKVVIRRRIQHKHEMRRQRAATLIQSYYRAYKARRFVRMYRKICTKSAVCLQKYVRRYLARRYVRTCLESVVKIQRWYRSTKITVQTKTEYMKIRRSVQVIQRWYRRRVLARKLEVAAVIIKEAKIEAKIKYEKAVIIQRVIRSYTIRRKFTRLIHQLIEVHRYSVLERTSAVKIQSYARMVVSRKRYIAIRMAAITIQQRWRAVKLARDVRCEFIQKKKACITIQNYYRSYRQMVADRISYLTLRSKVVLIQKRFREIRLTRQLRFEYITKYKKIVFLQQRFKATLYMKRQRELFLKQKEIAIKMQQRFRANRLMRLNSAEYKKLKCAAILIQSHFRGRVERHKYLHLKLSVIKIQLKWRATLAARRTQLEFLALQYSTTVVQRRYRATCLMRQERAEYLKFRQAVVMVQRRFRAMRSMRECLMNYQLKRKACLVIQMRFRSYVKMRIEKARYRGTREAVICIQQWFRACLERKRCQNSYNARKNAVKIIQCRYRAYLQMKKCRNEYLKKRSAALVLQSRYRAYKLMMSARNEYIAKRRYVVLIQHRFRANKMMAVEQQTYTKTKQAAIVIQQRFRATLEMRRVRKDYSNLRSATLVIQQNYRAMILMKKSRSEFIKLVHATRLIQARFRAKKSMEVEVGKFRALRSAAVIIQQRFRALVEGRQERSRFSALKNATICVQRKYRAIKSMKQVLRVYQEQRTSIITIQRYIKSYILMKRERKRFLLLKKSALIIQRRYRATIKMRRQHIMYLTTIEHIRYAQTLIRATLQMRKERRNFLLLKQTVIMVQRRCRSILYMKRERNQYLTIRNSAIIIQRRYRAYKSMCQYREEYLQMRQVVVRIQQKFRATQMMRIERQRFLELRSATIKIQQRFRAYRLCRIEQQKYRQIQKTVLGLQSHIRGNFARQRFLVMMSPEMIEARKRLKSARMIQRWWRGYKVRKVFSSWKMRTIRANIKKLKHTTQYSNTVKYKLMASIQFLKERFNIQEAFYYVKSLERTSRIIPHVLIEHASFICTVCYGIMAQAIRSEADKHIIEMCSRIILNLARYGPTTSAAFLENGFTTIAQMLLRWCDKECGIFNTLCTLMWVFSHSIIRRNKIREFLTSTEAIYMLRETKKLVIRKERMRNNVRKTSAHLPALASPSQRRALPSLLPDYGVAKTKPYIFVCSVFALETVLDKLEVSI